jgi:8-oxo-dGTP diphosphatase
MSYDYLTCPSCGSSVRAYKNPIPTVDIIIEIDGGIVLVSRKNEPHGWALPGGFVDYGETVEHAAIREAREETSLDITGLKLFGCYSDPERDPRQHTIAIVFIAKASGVPQAGDDAAAVALFSLESLPPELCFDHGKILQDYKATKFNP